MQPYTGSPQSPVVVIIPKANVEGTFQSNPYTFVTATDISSYDSAVENPLTVTSPNYTGEEGNYQYSCANAQVAIPSTVAQQCISPASREAKPPFR